MQEGVERSNNSEVLPQREFFAYLNHAANHEAKLLTFGVLLNEPDRAFTAAEIRRSLIESQGEPITWQISSCAGQKYCKLSLEPMGAVVRGSTVGRLGKPIDTYQANPKNYVNHFAFTGFLLDWSLRHPELSVQQAYGQTASGGGVQSPQVRHQIYLDLLTREGNAANIQVAQSIGGGGYKDRVSLQLQLADMADMGILRKRSKVNNYDPHILVTDDTFRHPYYDFSEVSAETRAVYGAMHQLKGKSELRLSDLIGAAVDEIPGIDVSILRTRIIDSLLRGTGLSGIRLAADEKVFAYKTALEIAPEHRLSIEELTAGMERVGTGLDHSYYVQRCQQILQDTTSFAALMQKAHDFSPGVGGKHRQETMEFVQSLAQEAGSLTVRGVQLELEHRYDRLMSAGGVRKLLKDMADMELLRVDTVRQSPTSQRRIRVYYPPD